MAIKDGTFRIKIGNTPEMIYAAALVEHGLVPVCPRNTVEPLPTNHQGWGEDYPAMLQNMSADELQEEVENFGHWKRCLRSDANSYFFDARNAANASMVFGAAALTLGTMWINKVVPSNAAEDNISDAHASCASREMAQYRQSFTDQIPANGAVNIVVRESASRREANMNACVEVQTGFYHDSGVALQNTVSRLEGGAAIGLSLAFAAALTTFIKKRAERNHAAGLYMAISMGNDACQQELQKRTEEQSPRL